METFRETLATELQSPFVALWFFMNMALACHQQAMKGAKWNSRSACHGSAEFVMIVKCVPKRFMAFRKYHRSPESGMEKRPGPLNIDNCPKYPQEVAKQLMPLESPHQVLPDASRQTGHARPSRYHLDPPLSVLLPR